MLDILLSPFMLRALVAAAATGLAAPAVGTYLVQRRLSLMGDGIGHICVTGVALGLLTGTSPVLAAIVVAVFGALLIELIRSTGKASGDVALALLFYGGIAGGLVLISLAGNSAFALQGYLFGSITSISTADVWVSVALAAVVILLCRDVAPPAVRGRARRGLRAHRRARRPRLQRRDLGARRGHRSRSRCAPSACCWSAR
jgi:zinc transport system permease protein